MADGVIRLCLVIATD